MVAPVKHRKPWDDRGIHGHWCDRDQHLIIDSSNNVVEPIPGALIEIRQNTPSLIHIERVQRNLDKVQVTEVDRMKARHNAERHPLKVIKRLSDLFWKEGLQHTITI